MTDQTPPKPYYDRDGITIWHADCRDVLPTIDPATVNLLLTDPPYGMSYKPLRGSDGSKLWAESVIGDGKPFNPGDLMRFTRLVLWGANHYANTLPPSGGWIVWDKTPRGAKEGFAASHAELAWTNLAGSVSKYAMQWGGEARGGEPHLHPTQKPVALMRWIIERWTKPGDLILDPYMGSGPVARAAQLLGRRYIGIELVESYCDAAVNRLAQPSMFSEGAA